jgi:hypothetical protein
MSSTDVPPDCLFTRVQLRMWYPPPGLKAPKQREPNQAQIQPRPFSLLVAGVATRFGRIA